MKGNGAHCLSKRKIPLSTMIPVVREIFAGPQQSSQDLQIPWECPYQPFIGTVKE